MSFTPKFVDLVRNVASVTGTGPVTLGPAVNGFAGLAGAVSTGEQFYYCIQGVDRPQEREVGRGTMQADGKIARQPIVGPATDFSNGSKTIALVAAAEWFERLDQLGHEAAVGVQDRGALAARAAGLAMLTEAGREGLFRFDPSDQAAKVAADVTQGIYVPAANDATGASGAWVRQVDGPVNPRWFGISTESSGAANDAAILAVFATLRARTNRVGFWSIAVEPIRFPTGLFNFASTIDLTDGNWLIEGAGPNDDSGTVLKFPAGVTGIRVQAEDTQGATGTRTPAKTSSRSIIRNLVLDGAYGGTESEAHGIHLRGAAFLENMYITDFQGDGVHINATATVDQGNANNSRLIGVRAVHNRKGFFVEGADSNVVSFISCDASANRTWGFDDSGFLGNIYSACHTATNGWVNGTTPTTCSHGGNRYFVKPGQAVDASTNAPSGTNADNSWWGYIGPGGANSAYNVVTWTSGLGWREGGAYRTDGANARHVLIGCYSEGDQNPAQLITPTLVLSGLHGAGVRGTAGYLRTGVSAGVVEADAFRFAYKNGTSSFSSQLGEQNAQTAFHVADSVDAPAAWRLKLSNKDLVFDYANGGLARSLHITGPNTTAQFGTGAAVPHALFAPHLCIGDSGESAANARRISVDTAAPSAGAHGQGEIVFNRTPTAGGKVGWICISAGTPGVWKAFGAIDA